MMVSICDMMVTSFMCFGNSIRGKDCFSHFDMDCVERGMLGFFRKLVRRLR